MSILASMRSKVLGASEMIAAEERALVKFPEEQASILASIESLVRMRDQMEMEYAIAASSLGYDLCRYRLLSDENRYRVNPLTAAVGSFQQFFSTVFDAVKNGAKERGRIAAETAVESAMEYAYAFDGSLGFAFTIPNERMLFEDFQSNCDEAIDVVCHLIVAKDVETISAYANKYGAASIRALRNWAVTHTRAGFGAGMRWERGVDAKHEFLIQLPELAALEKAIDNSSDEVSVEIGVVGMLTKIDTTHRRFTIEIDDSPAIEGTFTDAVGTEHEVTLPRRYSALVTKTTQRKYAFEQDVVTYHLESLKPMG